MSVTRIATIALLVFAAYGCMLFAPFKTLDDQYSIVRNPLLRESSHPAEIFKQGYFRDHSYYRPLVNLSFRIEYQLFGLKSFFYNLDNVLLHIMNALLVWAVVAALVNLEVGFWTALLFAIHPVQWEAVANISGRAILMGTFFSLISFWAYLRELRWLAVVGFALALLCKESSAVLPGILFLHSLIFHRRVWALWPWAVVLGLYVWLRHALHITEFFPWRNTQEHALGILTFARSMITHIRLFFAPVDLHFDRSLKLFDHFWQAGALLTMGFWLAVAGSLAAARKKITGLQWLALGWFGLCFLPVSQIVTTIGVQPGYMSTAEHFLYFASVPVLMLAVQALLPMRNLIVKVALVGFLGFLFVTTIEQNFYATSELAMMERSLRYQPNNARLQCSVGLVYALAGRFPQAEAHFRAAVASEPFNPRYLIALGKSVCDQGRIEECLRIYDAIPDPGGFATLLEGNRKAALAQSKR